MAFDSGSPVAISAFLLLVASGPLPLALWWTQRLRRGDFGQPLGASQFLHDTVMFWCAAQLLLGHAMGAAGLFRSDILAGAELAMLLTGLFCMRSSPAPLPVVQLGGNELAVAAAGAGVIMAVAVRCLVEMPGTYDSYGYHLPEIGRWIAGESLAMGPGAGASPISAYSYGWDVADGVFALVSRSDYLVMLPNVAALALLMLATYRVARFFGASQLIALCASVVSTSAPAVLKNVSAVSADVALAAAFMSSVAYGWEVVMRRRWLALAPFLLSLGMAAGAKTSGVSYAALAVIVTVVAWFERPPRTATSLPPPSSLLIAGAGAGGLFLGGFWMVRNAIYTGQLMPSVPDATAVFRTSLLGWRPWRLENAGIALQGFLEGTGFLLPCLLAVTWFAGAGFRASAIEYAPRWAIGVLSVGTLGLFIVTPYSATNSEVMTAWFSAQATRHGLSFVAAISAAVALIYVPRGQSNTLVTTVAAFVVGQLYLWIVLRSVPYRELAMQVTAVWPYAIISILAGGSFFVCCRNGFALRPRHFAFGMTGLAMLSLACLPFREASRGAWVGGVQLEVSRRFGTERALFLGGKWTYIAMGKHFDAQVFAVGGEDRLELGRTFDGSLAELMSAMDHQVAEYAIVGPFDEGVMLPAAVSEGLSNGRLVAVWRHSGAMILRRRPLPIAN